MKKKLLILVPIVCFVATNAQILTYVGDVATVYVGKQTLVYNGGGFQVDKTGKVDNYGNVMVVGGANDLFTANDGTSTKNSRFNLKFDLTDVSKKTYGQLYISGLTQANITGYVNKEYIADANNGATARQEIGLPFYGYTPAELKTTLDYVDIAATTYRFAPNTAFKWSNSYARYDQITTATATTGNPTDSYILPRRNSAATVVWDAASLLPADIRTFVGRPASDEATGLENSKLTLSGSYTGSFGPGGSAQNYYREKYNTYLDDPFRTAATSWDLTDQNLQYGRNLYRFSNPFLTNIDLAYINDAPGDADGDGNAITDLEGIAYYNTGSTLSWSITTGSTYATPIVATVSGGVFQGGDLGRLLLKPTTNFIVKMKNNTPATLLLNKTRRFAQTSRNAATAYDVTAAKGTVSSIPKDKIVKQVAVIMKDATGKEIERTYYAVSPSAVTGNLPGQQTLQGYVTAPTIYTKEELATGGEDVNVSSKLYINEANEINFAGKEIPLVINNAKATSLSFEVYEGGQLLQTGAELSNNKSFYIKKDNAITKITNGDTMSLAGTRFGLYYELPQGALGTNDSSKNQTVIAKKDNDWVIRFASDWKKADVEIYSVTGQLIHINKNVTTNNDYVLPINSQVNGLFLVKTTSSDGKVVTKKIIK